MSLFAVAEARTENEDKDGTVYDVSVTERPLPMLCYLPAGRLAWLVSNVVVKSGT